MKRWLFCAAAIALVALAGWMPFSGSDVATLQPVELIRVSASEGVLTLYTDTGDMGRGATVTEALYDLKRTTAGRVFLDTADFLLVEPAALSCLSELTGVLRPACRICLVDAWVELKRAADFLRIQSENITLQHYREGQRVIPYLKVSEERIYLAAKEN